MPKHNNTPSFSFPSPQPRRITPHQRRRGATRDPDLQGIWSGDSAFGIPMQRPESFGTRAELNDKEYAEKVARDETRAADRAWRAETPHADRDVRQRPVQLA